MGLDKGLGEGLGGVKGGGRVDGGVERRWKEGGGCVEVEESQKVREVLFVGRRGRERGRGRALSD